MARDNTLLLFPRLKGVLLIFLLSLYFYWLAGKIQGAETPGQLGPAFWPKAALILLMIGCGIKSLEILFSREKGVDQQETPSPAVNHLTLFMMITLVILVVFAMDKIGFLLTNFLFLIIFMRVAGMRKKKSLLLISALGTILLLYLFVKVVYLPLPKGYGLFEDITLFVYRILRII